MMKSLRGLLLICCAALISACGFWGGVEEVKPNPLVDFTAENSVSVVWSSSIGSGPGRKYHQMRPAIDGNRIFAADSKGLVVALDRSNGQRHWSVNLKDTLMGGVGAGYGKVFVTTESGLLVALDASDGTEVWRRQLASEVTSPAQANPDIVVAQLVSGRLTALDLRTGEHRWTYDAQIPSLTLRGTSSPLVTSDVTFAGFANGRFLALQNDNGSVLWDQRISLTEGRSELERIVDVDGRAILLDNLLYVVGYQGRLVAINPFNAQVIWALDMSSYRSLASGFGNLYVAEANDFVQAVDAGSSASVWRQTNLENRQLTSPGVLGRTVVVGDYEGYLHFMSQTDGRFMARYRVDSSGLRGDMLVVDDTLYVLSNAGRLMALRLN
ncbi:outer membrane protein assembly factor BamB [Nitrincola alkalilacustris]|uniref:outer membrane protein assembly factor BamB n=1 Tax=Nitrincola alkalilacustris TaxID=1571224 RepID=UPI001F0E6F91|nr:outer membrane protein assembly factor BamB [Nitrincola alkalilacustris]